MAVLRVVGVTETTGADMVYPMVVSSKAGAVVLSVLQEWLGSWEIMFGPKGSPARPAHYRKVVGISCEIIPRPPGPRPQDGGRMGWKLFSLAPFPLSL